MKITILGAGIGGMSCAALLAKNGLDVSVIEQSTSFGGKAGCIEENGFKFDTGPCLMTYPEWFDELFKSCGKNPREYFTFKKLNTVTRYFDNGKVVDVKGNINDTANAFQKALKLDADLFLDYMAKWNNIYKISEKIFLLDDLNFDTRFLKEAVKWMSSNGISNIYKSMSSYNCVLNNSFAEKIMNRFATYTGSSPFKTPAFMNQISVVEMINGAYYPDDGIYSLPAAINKLCVDLGVKFKYNTKITRIEQSKNVMKIHCEKDIFSSHTLVSNIDYHLTQSLLGRKTNFKKLKLSSSGIVFYWGIKNNSKNLSLHNIIFSEDYQNEFESIFEKKIIPEDPTIFINITSKMDPHHAPEHFENWFVMINTPPNFEIVNSKNIKKLKEIIIRKIKINTGINISQSIVFEKILTPKTLHNDTGSIFGSIYGQNQNSFLSILKRKGNQDKHQKNLYYVGGTVHPGGGMPLALRSGINVANKIIN